MSYKRFFGMIITSTVIMYGLMYATAYRLTHVWFSETRLWMALFMGAMMAIVMMAWMLNMYENKKANIGIFVGAGVLFVLGIYLARSQVTVDQVSWMKAMIPHHSIAILTSERATITDPRVRRLADEIILAQRREIAEMEGLIHDLEGSDVEGGEPLPPTVPPVEGGSVESTGPVPGAPALTLGGAPLVGDVLVVDEVKVVSDAWVVAHPAAPGGGPDLSQVLGRSFVMHGTTERVPLDLDGTASGDSLYLMLHADTGDNGRFEFEGPGSDDPPLLENGEPVTAAVALR